MLRSLRGIVGEKKKVICAGYADGMQDSQDHQTRILPWVVMQTDKVRSRQLRNCWARGGGSLFTSNGNASEAKANEGFDNSIFFASEAKRTCSLEGNLLAKRSEHVRKK